MWRKKNSPFFFFLNFKIPKRTMLQIQRHDCLVSSEQRPVSSSSVGWRPGWRCPCSSPWQSPQYRNLDSIGVASSPSVPGVYIIHLNQSQFEFVFLTLIDAFLSRFLSRFPFTFFSFFPPSPWFSFIFPNSHPPPDQHGILQNKIPLLCYEQFNRNYISYNFNTIALALAKFCAIHSELHKVNWRFDFRNHSRLNAFVIHNTQKINLNIFFLKYDAIRLVQF